MVNESEDNNIKGTNTQNTELFNATLTDRFHIQIMKTFSRKKQLQAT